LRERFNIGSHHFSITDLRAMEDQEARDASA
jgi:hypothetical protein